MLKQQITAILNNALLEAQKAGKLPAVTMPEIIIERPQKEEHGDYASSIALKLARAVGASPLSIARDIASFVPADDELTSVSVAHPGFINFTLKKEWITRQVDAIMEAGESYGNIDFGQNKPIQIEFVSVNPTGPLHVGHGRGAVLGSTLANVLSAAGYQVEKEYYVNDAGNQIDTFRQSLYARYQQSLGKQVEVPADGYHGDYITTAAAEIAKAEGNKFSKLSEAEQESIMGERGLQIMLKDIESDLQKLRVTFDVWYREKDLYANGQFKKVMELLRKGGYIAEKEGATWFISTALGEDKDNVVVRTDGTPTYFGSDIAYHYNKFIERKFDRVINIWGADHAGHVSRMKAVMGALGVDPARLEIIISQMVTLRRGGEIVKISKRSGDIITLRDLLDEVGVDACRYFFLFRSADSQMDFDLELAKKQSSDNPVYYIQYAHARIASILRLAEERGAADLDGDVSLLTTEPELTLIRRMLLLPELVETIAQTLEPHHLTYYAQELATAFHLFYKHCRVVTDDEAMTGARLKLVKAAKITLGRSLTLMGMKAPDKM
jgi:arginyl-tRNA synthetase